jgi:tetratricopeptide (TPR) repeat protein
LGSYQEYAEAIPILEKVPTNSKGYQEVSYDLALAYFHSNAYEAAVAKLQPALLGPQSAEAFSLLGDIEAARRRFPEAINAFRKSTEKDPANESVWFAYGLALFQHDEAAQSVAVFTNGLTHLPESARLRLGLGAALCASGMYDSGADTLLYLVASHPHIGLSYYLLGEIYEVTPPMQDKITGVLAEYIRSKPRNPLAYFEYGKILFLRAQSAAAESNLRIALTQDPKLAEAYVQLAAIAQNRGRLSDSVVFLQKALALKPALSGAHYKLAMALRKLGRSDQAKAEMELYMRQKSNEQVARKQEVLRSLALEGHVRP